MTENNVYVRAGSLLLALLLALMLVACGSDDEGGDTDTGAQTEESPDTEAPGGGEVTVNATEYAFDLPETLPAGETTFSLANQGDEDHMLIMAELKPDAPPIEELVKMPEKEANKFLVQDYTIPPIGPGETSSKTITLDLEAGTTYGYVCFVPSPKKSEGHGQPHAFLGMIGELTAE